MKSSLDVYLVELNGLLGHLQMDLTGPDAKDKAIGIQQQQQARWHRLTSLLSEPNTKVWIYHPYLKNLKTALEKAVGSATCSQSSKGWMIESNVPLILNEIPNSVLELGQKYIIETACLLTHHCQKALEKLPHGTDDFSPFLITSKFGVVLNAIQDIEWQSNRDAKLGEITSALLKVRQIDEDLNGKSLELSRHADSLIVSNNSLLSQTQSALREAIENIQNSAVETLKSKSEELTSQFRGLESELIEFSKIKATTDLWNTKGNWHLAGAYVFGILFLIGLTVIPLLMFFGYIAPYIDLLKTIPTDHQFIGIALLLIPTLATAWCLKFLARLALLNLSLSHDAKLRHSQIETYLKLLSDTRKPISERERTLALYALFRGLPGSQTEEVNPPTLADLIKENTIGAMQR